MMPTTQFWLVTYCKAEFGPCSQKANKGKENDKGDG